MASPEPNPRTARTPRPTAPRRWQTVTGPNGFQRIVRVADGLDGPDDLGAAASEPLEGLDAARTTRDDFRAEVDALRAQGEDAAALSEHLRKRIGAFARAVRSDAAVRHRLFPKLAAATEAKAAPAPHGVTGEQQRAARLALGLSQRQLAAHFGVQRSQLAEAERGRRKVNPALAPWVRQTLRLRGPGKPEASATGAPAAGEGD
jgi:DNA-binding transcriptional regulator YiaG